VDIDPLTFNIDPAKIDAAVTTRTRCIMPVHLFGLPADMPSIVEYAVDYDLRIVEDSCEAMLARVDGVPVGAWGNVACFSTYAAHLLVTGVGGMATTDEPDLAQVMRSLVNHGIDLTELPCGDEYDPTWLARKFRFNRIGHSYRVTELEAAIGLAQLDSLPTAIGQRQVWANYLALKLAPLCDRIALQKAPRHTWPSPMVFPLVLYIGDKWPLMRHLQAAGIECREAMPLTNQPCYGFNEADYPVAAWVNRGGVYVGCHEHLTIEQLDYMVETIGGFFDARI
jgi:perosamine synthetase